ncbi:hypothetical protein MNBD_ALPHA05-43 [hydrothermal vent metagenome]|uniref:Uncharacterized protein n=1 Tax=hydrothermal vent metagenome TaxID=652676 RepID=A0A3B0TG79_9ZZZZ
MAERLREIWSGFAEVTTRNLTGKGVEGIIVPHRADYAPDDSQFLPEAYEGPAARAFETLRADLAAKNKKFSRRKQAEPSPQSEAAAQRAGDDLFQGMHATTMRIERTDLDYGTYLSSDVGKAALKKHKKKRFGIF